jgi:hypothetical protein
MWLDWTNSCCSSRKQETGFSPEIPSSFRQAFDTAKYSEPPQSDMDDEESAETDEGRVTAPMQSFGSREVTIGFVVLAIGLLLAFVLPLAF